MCDTIEKNWEVSLWEKQMWGLCSGLSERKCGSDCDKSGETDGTESG